MDIQTNKLERRRFQHSRPITASTAQVLHSNIDFDLHGFVCNVQTDSAMVDRYRQSGYHIGPPKSTCMSYPSVKIATQRGFVGVYSKDPVSK